MFEVLITYLYLALSLQVTSIFVGNPNVLNEEQDNVFLSVAVLYKDNKILFGSTPKKSHHSRIGMALVTHRQLCACRMGQCRAP